MCVCVCVCVCHMIIRQMKENYTTVVVIIILCHAEVFFPVAKLVERSV